MSTLKYFVWLSTMDKISKKTAYLAIKQLGSAENVYLASENQINGLQGINPEEKKRLMEKSLDVAQRTLEECEKKDISLMTILDADYPERLKNIAVPPIVLYIKGKKYEMDDSVAITFVGQRKASRATCMFITELARDFALAGGLVVSGMAHGIDGASHRGAMKAGRPTVAVLGCGVDRCYPVENRDIYDYIAKNGTLISEYPPGTPPLAFHFPERNRILSAISLGVVVAEAPSKSGSLITVHHALEQCRDVFVVPGNVGDGNCDGSNNLLKDGAKPITNAMDIIEEYIGIYPHIMGEQDGFYQDKFQSLKQSIKKVFSDSIWWKEQSNEKKIDHAPVKNKEQQVEISKLKPLPNNLTSDEQAIINAMGDIQTHIDKIIVDTGLPADSVLSAVTTLEIKGTICQLPGKYFKRI